VPVNSQAHFHLARDLLIAYLFCWRTLRGNRENRNHFPLLKAEMTKSESRNQFQLSQFQLSIRPSSKSLSILICDFPGP